MALAPSVVCSPTLRKGRARSLFWLLLAHALLGCAHPRGAGSVRSLASPSTRGAREWVRAAAAAMGGEDRLRSLRTARLEGIGHVYLVEQSERPEGPWATDSQKLPEAKSPSVVWPCGEVMGAGASDTMGRNLGIFFAGSLAASRLTANGASMRS